jgi:lipopolysaccharide export LptBFGC system permease protein LptF
MLVVIQFVMAWLLVGFVLACAWYYNRTGCGRDPEFAYLPEVLITIFPPFAIFFFAMTWLEKRKARKNR